jgi:arylsulfatase A-like enzyme
MRLRRVFPFFFAVTFLASSLGNARAADHVVLVVFDGLRPDLVTEKNTPALWALSQRGVFFEKHHPVYLSATAVNCVALATGAYAHKNGVMGNVDYYPALDARKPLNVDYSGTLAVKQADDAKGGQNIVRMPTLAEILHAAGKRTVIAGAKDVAIWQDRATARPNDAAKNSPTLFAGKTLNPDVLSAIETKIGPFPTEVATPAAPQNDWTRQALTDVLWSDGVPAFSLLWLSEPDATQHKCGPGSPEGLAALKDSDDNLAAVLAVLQRKGVLAQTDVLVVSDHGFSTVSQPLDLVGRLNGAGFHAMREFPAAPQPGDVLTIAEGGSSFLYVANHDAATIAKLVAYFQQAEFIGALFTPKKMEGTLPLSSIRLDRAATPDVVISYRWTDAKNEFGVPGSFIGDGSTKGPKGSHASLSRYDMHNTLVAAGPDFKKAFRDELPSGNADVAPTILTLLGQPVPAAMEGRVLSESLSGKQLTPAAATTTTLTATRIFPKATWAQYLQISRVGPALYLDEANGRLTTQ